MKFLNRKIKILALLLALFFCCTNAQASDLPIDLSEYIQKELPKSNKRFDAVIVISDDVMYAPIYPTQTKVVDKIEVEYTYPKGKTLSQLPEIITFNNNFALLKIFKDSKGEYTLTNYEEFPMKIKLGLLPQDMLVPVGLKVNDSLKLILGDLLIPSKGEGNLVYLHDDDKYNPSKSLLSNEFIPLADLNNKKTYLTTFDSKFMYVYNNKSKAPVYELKLSSLPSKIIASNASKLALILYFSNKTVEVVDLKDERILSTITLDGDSKDVDLDKNTNIAYVSSQNANTIYCIDLNSAKMERAIRLEQAPSSISVSNDGNSIAFIDGLSGDLYNLNLQGEIQVNPIGKTKNITKIFCDDKNIWAISRTENKLYTFDKATSSIVAEHKLKQKPTDAVMKNGKIYILCSKDNYLDVFDTKEQKVIYSKQLEKNGFYTKITLIPNQTTALITGLSAKSFLVFDLNNLKIVKRQSSQIDVSNVVIMDEVKVQDL